MPKKKRRDGRILRVSLRAVLGLLGVVLAGNALFVVVPSFKTQPDAFSTDGSRPPGQHRLESSATCEGLRRSIAQRTDRQLLRNGGGYACAECETVLSSGHDDHLRSCSKCGAIPPPQRPSGGSSAAGVLNDARLPDTSGIDVTVERTKLLDWFAHQGNARMLGHANLTQLLPATPQEALNGFADGGAWGKCAVVGSGGSLWRSGLGREIDSHDVVLRVNQAPTVGYERHVGRRTHVRMLNNRWSMKYSHDRQSPSAAKVSASMPLEEGVMALLTRADEEDYRRLHSHLATTRPDVRMRLLSSRVISTVRDRMLVPYRTKLNATCEEPLLWSVAEGRDTPSSGLVAVALLLQLCEGVAVYGFSGTNDGKRYHYFKGNRNYMNRTHSFSAERALLRALARDGRIQFVEGNTEFVTGGV